MPHPEAPGPGDEEHRFTNPLEYTGPPREELPPNIREAGWSIFKRAMFFESMGQAGPENSAEFVDELTRLGLSRDELLPAISFSLELSRTARENARAGTLDPFIAEELGEEKAEAVWSKYVDDEMTQQSVDLLLSDAKERVEFPDEE